MTTKKNPLTCGCGGTPVREKSRSGKFRVRCKCGKQTAWHSRVSEATKEWKKVAMAPVQKDARAEAEKKEKKAPKKASPKAASVQPKAFQGEEAKKAVLAGLAEVSTLAKRLSKAIDITGGIVAAAFGLDSKDVEEAVKAGVKRGFSVAKDGPTVNAAVIDGEAAKKIVRALAEVGAVPKALAEGFCKHGTKNGGK